MVERSGASSDWSQAAQPALNYFEALFSRDGLWLLNSQILERVIAPLRTRIQPLQIKIDTSVLKLRLYEVHLLAESGGRDAAIQGYL